MHVTAVATAVFSILWLELVGLHEWRICRCLGYCGRSCGRLQLEALLNLHLLIRSQLRQQILESILNVQIVDTHRLPQLSRFLWRGKFFIPVGRGWLGRVVEAHGQEAVHLLPALDRYMSIVC